MKDIRKDAISGMIEGIGLEKTSLQFSEWHGKEGLDLTFYNPFDDEVKHLSLSRDELHCLMVACIAANYVDAPSAEREAKEMIEDSEKRHSEQEKQKMMATMPNPLTGLGDLNALSSL
jgi:hypothetical protein